MRLFLFGTGPGYAEKNVSTQNTPPFAGARLSQADEDSEWARCNQGSTQQGPQASHRPYECTRQESQLEGLMEPDCSGRMPTRQWLHAN